LIEKRREEKTPDELLRFEHIAAAPNRTYQPVIRLDLMPERFNVGVDSPVAAEKVRSPNFFEYTLPAHGLTGMTGKVLKQ
jgi:hypothetical protein